MTQASQHSFYLKQQCHSELQELKKHTVERVVKDPTLLILLLKVYSEIFLNSKPCSTCEKDHPKYYRRLIKEGDERLKKMELMAKTKVCKMKPTALMHYKGTHFTDANITDKIATAAIKKFPGLAKNFSILPPGTESEEVANASVKKKLGIAVEKDRALEGDLKKLDKDLKEAEKAVEKYAESSLEPYSNADNLIGLAKTAFEEKSEAVDKAQAFLDKAEDAVKEEAQSVLSEAVEAKEEAEAELKVANDTKDELDKEKELLADKVTEAEDDYKKLSEEQEDVQGDVQKYQKLIEKKD